MAAATTAALLAAVCLVAIAYGVHTPEAVPASAPPTVFSAERAMRHVEQMAQRPHPTGSQDNARVREYLMTELRALGLAPDIQDVTGVATRYAAAGHVRNVVVRVPGRQPGGPAVLVMAHYDGVAAGPAASDDASGSAALLEALRALKAGPPPVHDIIALFTDAEEDGLVGAAAFVREHPWVRDVAVVLNFEARGSAGPSYMFETGPGNLNVVRRLRRTMGVRSSSLNVEVYRQLPNDTDLSEIALLGVPAMNFAFIGRVDHYHTTQDDPAHLDRGSLQHHGNQVLELARAFANGPLPLARTSDAVFFDLPGIGLVMYAVRWALPIAITGFLLVAVAISRLRSRESKWLRGVLLGTSATLVSALVSAATAAGMGMAIARLHASLGGMPELSGVYLGAAALLVVAVTTACHALGGRWASATGMFLGALLVWAALAVFVAWVAPGASFLLAWPLLAAIPGALEAAGSTTGQMGSMARWLATLVTVFLVVPTVYVIAGVALGLAIPGAVSLGVLGSLALWALAPQMESIAGPRRWRAPLLALGGSLLLAGVGFVTVRTSDAHPVGASLVYDVDEDGSAWLTGIGFGAAGRAWVSQAVRSLNLPAKGTPPEWALMGPGRAAIAAAPAPSVALDGPNGTVVNDSTTNGSRYVTVRVRAPAGTLNVLMSAASGVVLSAAVDGRPVDTKRYRHQNARWQLQYVAPPDTGFLLTIAVPPGSHPAIDLLARSSGMPALRAALPPRPPGVIPVQAGDRTVVHRRLVL